ncbi:MAG: hypothetical protein KBG28_06440 [Kofleriaceae bacterium]|nr:hypothetical protein [Kofleriaceae bacterium]MBP6841293.1 hypothetical protein [Kofleriaceae bacterium]MBP9203579.1 hypothetical protein [Kofleriaceae bacterium]
MTTKRFVIAAWIGLAGAAAAAGCGSDARAPKTEAVAPADAAALLTDRNWIDHMPRRKDERLHVYRFVPSMGGGVYQDRTVFRGEFELFTYKVERDRLSIRWPNDDRTTRTTFRIDRVDGPDPFDLRLTLADSPNGPRVYYGNSHEHDRTGAVLDALLAR